MGFGHRVYKNFDPRAKVMRETCHDVLKELNIQDPLLDVAMELERIDAQTADEPPEHAVSVILGQVIGQRLTGIGQPFFGSAIGPAGPIGAVEQLAIGGDGLDAGERIRV